MSCRAGVCSLPPQVGAVQKGYSTVKPRSPLNRSGVQKHGRAFKVNTTVGGHRVVASGFRTPAAAAEWISQLSADPTELERYIQRRQRGRKTVADVVDAYLWRCVGLKSERVYTYQARHLVRLLGSVEAAAVRQRDVDGYCRARGAEGAGGKAAFNELALLRSSLRYAWMNDELPQPPKFKLARPRSERDRVAWPEEIFRLLGFAEVPLRRVILAGATLGLRAGEIVRAEWAWVDGARRELRFPTTKNGRPKRVPLPPALWELCHAEPRHPVWLFPQLRHGVNGHGTPEPAQWSYHNLHDRFEALCLQAGVEGLHLHDLRRSMASLAHDLGAGQTVVQALGGWEDPAVLQRHYSRPRDGAVRGLTEALERAVLGGVGAVSGQGFASQIADIGEPRRT